MPLNEIDGFIEKENAFVLKYLRSISVLLGFLLLLLFIGNAFSWSIDDVSAFYNNNVPSNVLENTKIVWCEQSVKQFSEEDKLHLGLINFSDDPSICTCYPSDIVSETSFRDLYCEDSDLGLLKQVKIVVRKIKPECTLTEQVPVYHDLQADFCKVCPKPESISEWKSVQCLNDNQLIQKQSIIAYLWDNDLKECHKINAELINIVKSDSCSIPFVNKVVQIQNYWWIIFIGLILLIFIVLKLKRWI